LTFCSIGFCSFIAIAKFRLSGAFSGLFAKAIACSAKSRAAASACLAASIAKAAFCSVNVPFAIASWNFVSVCPAFVASGLAKSVV